MIILPIGFDGGINTRKVSHALAENEMQSCQGFSLENMGKLVCRNTRTAVNQTAVGAIHTMHRYMNWVLCGDGASLRYKWDLDKFCDLYTPANDDFTLMGTVTSTDRWSVATYAKWMFMVNGRDKKAMTKGNLYDWGIEPPETAPNCADGAAGNPSGTYSLVYTYYVKFPNGEVYETGPSPAKSHTTSGAKALSWSGITTCPYSGTGLVIWRKLYRTVSGVYYCVTTLKDNTTLTYTDDLTDAALDDNNSIDTTGFYVPPDNMIQIESYLERMWGIKGNTLYPSQAYLPFDFKPLSTIVVSKEGEDLTAVKSWGDQLYVASRRTWYRLQGNDPDTWGIKRTFADSGIVNGHTAKVTKYGILGLWYDGIYAFDGSTSRNITQEKIGTTFFTSTVTNRDACYAEWDGVRYYFYYPISGTTLGKCLIIDFTYYPELRFYHDDFIALAHQFHKETGLRYLAKTGYQYEEKGSAETIATSLRSRGVAGEGQILQRKNIQYLWYEINTGGVDVTVTFYVDGVLQSHTKTINHASRTRNRIGDFPPTFEGYWFEIALSCANSSSLEIYSPWALGADPSGT